MRALLDRRASIAETGRFCTAERQESQYTSRTDGWNTRLQRGGAERVWRTHRARPLLTTAEAPRCDVRRGRERRTWRPPTVPQAGSRRPPAQPSSPLSWAGQPWVRGAQGEAYRGAARRARESEHFCPNRSHNKPTRWHVLSGQPDELERARLDFRRAGRSRASQGSFISL